LTAHQFSNSQNSMNSFYYSWFLAKNLSNFVSLSCKLNNPYYHSVGSENCKLLMFSSSVGGSVDFQNCEYVIDGWSLSKLIVVHNWALFFSVYIFKNSLSWNLQFSVSANMNSFKKEGTFGKSLSEALIFAENGENMLCTLIVLNVKINFRTQHVLPMFWAWNFHVLNLYFNEQYIVILWVSWYKNKSFWQRFTCIHVK